MTRKYHRWTFGEINRVCEYIEDHEHPTSLYDLETLADEFKLSLHSVRGAVVREMARKRSDDLREG